MIRLHVEQYGPDDYRGRMEFGPAGSFDLHAGTWPELLMEIRLAYHVLVGGDATAANGPELTEPQQMPAEPAAHVTPTARVAHRRRK